MLDLVTNSFLSKLASHEYHASKPIPPEAKRKYGLKKERREYEAEKPVPPEVAEDLGLEKEHHKEAADIFAAALLHKLAESGYGARRPIPKLEPPDSYGRSKTRRHENRPHRKDRESKSMNSLAIKARESAELRQMIEESIKKHAPKRDEQPDTIRRFSADPSYHAPLPQEIVIDMPKSGPSGLGRMATFGGAGALANLLLGKDSESKKSRAVKGALIGAGLGGLYHLLRK